MIEKARERFNRSFSEEKYHQMLHDLNSMFHYHIPFRVAESPVFVPKWFSDKMFMACREMISFISHPAFKEKSQGAIPPHLYLPGEGSHSIFLAFDFGICRNEKGEIIPQLIELQGFPSLFGWQHLLAKHYRRFFEVEESLNHLFTHSEEEYLSMVKQAISGNQPEENTILLEIDPDNQNTRIDFLMTEKLWGVRAVCISKIKSAGRELYYEHNGRRITIHRIYNRVIFDELQNRPDITPGFDLMQEYDVEWAGHPNWFFRISKYLMPWLKGEYIPPTYFLNELKTIPEDLENYVLKPLFSFSGSGVVFHVTRQDIDAINNPSQYILQRKVNYEPVIRSPENRIKAELRLLFLWNDAESNPQPVINMARLSQGEMIGVKYNKNKTWVGGSVGFYE
jgi:hypothetical protein